MTHQTQEQQAIQQRDFALMANISALCLQFSKFTLNREGAPAAYEVALAHHEAWKTMSGRTAPGIA